VVDDTPPTITCPADMTMGATNPDGVVVTFTATATDACDPNPTVTCTPPSGSTFPIGTTAVSCTATDASGHQASCSFTVRVTPLACTTTVAVEANFVRKGSTTVNKVPVAGAKVVMLPKSRVQAVCANLLDANCVWANLAAINTAGNPVVTTDVNGRATPTSSVADPNGWAIYSITSHWPRARLLSPLHSACQR